MTTVLIVPNKFQRIVYPYLVFFLKNWKKNSAPIALSVATPTT